MSGWLCGCPRWNYVFRGVGKNFSSSAKPAALLLLHGFLFSKSNQTLLCNIGQLFPSFYCSAPFFLFPLHLGQPNFPSPKMILVSSSYPTSKSDLKEEAIQRSNSSEQHLCIVYYLKEPLNLHLVFKSKLYIFMEKTGSEAMPWVRVASV